MKTEKIEFNENKIYMLSAWGDIDGTDKTYIEDDCDYNGIAFVLNGETYVAIDDKADGWRSYSYLKKAKRPVKMMNEFTPQTVKIQNIYTDSFNGIKIVNPFDGSIIAELGTLDFGDYYPMCHHVWHPENLPINKIKLN